MTIERLAAIPPSGEELISVTLAPMFGIRVLIYLAGIALVIWILMRLAKGPRVEKKTSRQVDDMVRCSRCGIFVPRHEAIQSDSQYYCCAKHRDEDR